MYKSIILAVYVLAGLAWAQIPTCADSCITLPAGCNADPSCICNNAQWIANVSCCVLTKCDTSDQQAALSYANTICTPVGVTLPTAASCNNSTSSATGSASSSGTAVSSASSALKSVTSSASSVVSSASSASSAASSAAAASASSKAFGNQIHVPGAGGVLGALVGAVALL